MELNERRRKIVDHLINSETLLSVTELSALYGVSNRTIYYDLEEINYYLERRGVDPIEITHGKGIGLSNKQKEKLALKSESQGEHIFTPDERIRIILCVILARDHLVLIEDFIALCKVSRNTILSDLKAARELLENYDFKLEYSKERGYVIKGNVIKKRALFFMYFKELSESCQWGYFEIGHQELMEKNLARLRKIEEELGYKFIKGIAESLAFFFSTIKYRKDIILLEEEEVVEISKTQEFQLVKKYFEELSSFEQIYMSLHLLGSRLQKVSFQLKNEYDQEPYDLACGLISEFERWSAVDFHQDENLREALFLHLKTSLYRYRYGIQMGNPLLNDIRREYRDLFNLCKKSVEYLEKKISFPISDSEVAYLTLHFGSALNKYNQTVRKVLVICPDGLSPLTMLKTEIQGILGDQCEVDGSSTETDREFDYDLIISTIKTKTIKNKSKLVRVHPILTSVDRISIMKKSLVKGGNFINTEGIFNLIAPYIKEESSGKVKRILESYLDRGVELEKADDESVERFLGNPKFCHISLEENVKWKKSILETGKLLEDAGYAHHQYCPNIIKRLEEYGPYMFITEGVFLAHAKVTDGSLQKGMSFGFYPKGILFAEDKIAYLIIVLSCENQNSHMKMLTEVISFFGDKEYLKKLRNIKTKKDIEKMIE